MKFEEDIKELKSQMYEKNVNFLIGSGASIPYFKTLGNIEEILSDSNLDEKLRGVIYLYYYNKCVRRNEDLLSEDSFHENVSTQNYVNFIEQLTGSMNYRNDRISPKRANVFTTNYDIFFEKAINIVQKYTPSLILNDGGHGYFNRFISADNYHKTVSRNGVFDNYHKELFSLNLIKCHGSVTWEKSNGNLEIKGDLGLLRTISKLANLVNLTTEEEEMIGRFLSNDSVIPEDGEELLGVFHNRNELLETFLTEYQQLTIINPEKTKFSSTVMEEHYYSMLRLLSYELEREQTILIVFGFSFADEHIRNLIKRSVHNPSLRIYIFAYSNEAAKGIDVLLNIGHQKNIVIFEPNENLSNIGFKQFNKLLFGNL